MALTLTLDKSSGKPREEIRITRAAANPQDPDFTESIGVSFPANDELIEEQIEAMQYVDTPDSIVCIVPDLARSGEIAVHFPNNQRFHTEWFKVIREIPPEETPTGRGALNALVLAMAAKRRGDKVTVAQTFDREAVLREGGGFFTVITRPSGQDQIAAYQSLLSDNWMITSFNLDKMVIVGASVLMIGKNDSQNARFTILMRQTSNGFVIYLLGIDDL